MKLKATISLNGSTSDFTRHITQTVWNTELLNRGLFAVDQIVHCHIPKTAGVSFYSRFKPFVPSFHADHKNVQGSLQEIGKLRSRERPVFYTGHYNTCDLVNVVSGISLVVCLIRHPIERLISHYNYNCSEQHTWHEDFRSRFPTIEDFVMNDEFANNPMSKQLFSKLYVDQSGFKTQDGRPIYYAFATQDNIDRLSSEIRQALKIKGESAKSNELNKTPVKDRIITSKSLGSDILNAIKARNYVDLQFFWAVKKSEDIRKSIVE